MKKGNSKPTTTTTLSCSKETLDYVRELAARNHRTHRETLAQIVEFHKGESAKKATQKDDFEKCLASISGDLRKLTKRDDTVISFIKKQEDMFLNPMHQELLLCKKYLLELTEILKKL